MADAAGRIIDLLGRALSAGQKPYAAVLYAFDQTVGSSSAHVVAEGHNTEGLRQNSLAHAEINVLNAAARPLWEHKQIPLGERTQDFYLFVNTRSCPKCTAAIADSQIFEVRFFWDNGYSKTISESILGEYERILREKGNESRPYVFKELESEFLNTIRGLTENG